MTSEEYIEQVNRLIDLQNDYANKWISIIGIVVTLVLAMQIYYNYQQAKQIKSEAQRETIDRICKELNVSSLNEVKFLHEGIKIRLDNVEKKIEDILGDQFEPDYNLNELGVNLQDLNTDLQDLESKLDELDDKISDTY